MNISYVIGADRIYSKLSRLDQVTLENTMNSILNGFRGDNRLGVCTFIVVATPDDLNIDFGSKKISSESLEDKNYAWDEELL